MSRPPIDAAALRTAAYNLVISKSYALASTVMLIYDTILTFDREVEVIWKSRWSGVKALFFFNRYANIGTYLVSTAALHSTWPRAVCQRYVYFPGVFNLVQQAAIGAIFILFLFALFDQSKLVLYLVSSVYIAQIVVIGWSLGAVTSVPLPPGFVGCIFAGRTGTGIRIITSWIMQLVFISVVFGLMIWKAVMLTRDSMRAPVVTLMTRDGLKSFGIIFSANFINVMTFALEDQVSLRSVNATFAALITVLVVSRMVLTLREEASKDPTLSTIDTHGHITFSDTIMNDVDRPRFVAEGSRAARSQIHRRTRSIMSEGFAADLEEGEAYAMDTRNRAESRQSDIQATAI